MISDGKYGPVVIGEIKTVGDSQHWSYVAKSVEDIPRRYQVQVAWQMMVTGAEACFFVWERRAGVPGAFSPDGDPQFIIIRPDRVLEEELRQTALRFVAGEDPLDESGLPPGLVWELVEELTQAQAAREAAAAEVDRVKAQIRDALGDEDYSWSDDETSLSWRMPKPRRVLDQKALKAAHPDIVRNFMVEKPASGRVLRVTKKKGGK